MTPETILLRQIHPNFLPDGQLSSQAFMPFPKDQGGLSVYDGDKISPQHSHKHYTQELHLESAGVWGVSNKETKELNLVSKEDPLPDFPSHVLIDFSQHHEKDFRKIAKKLKAFASARGCLYSTK